MKRTGLAVFSLLLAVFVPAAEKKRDLIPMPDGFVLGRHTFMDFGPPFDYYEVLSVGAEGPGTWVERIVVTPPGLDLCAQPATVEVEKATLPVPVSELLGGSNPCTIPEKALHKELKRCKKCLVFSGAEVTMSAQCGDKPRLIRMDILDRDMFDPAPKTPEHTSWTMTLLARLDHALGPGVWDRPAFSLQESKPARAGVPDSGLAALGSGAYDVLFKQAPHKPSEIYAQSQIPPPQPAVELAQISPFRPLSDELPKYPPLARMARISGTVSFVFDLTSDGTVQKVRFTGGHPLLLKAVEVEVTKWRFPAEAAGQSIQCAIKFTNNCFANP